MGGGYFPTTIPEALGALSVLLAFVNVSGGFVITKRMLDMFKRKYIHALILNAILTVTGPTDPPEYPWLYAIPGLIFGGGYIAAASTGMAGLVQAGYLVSSVLCISKIFMIRSYSFLAYLFKFYRLHIRPRIPVDCTSRKYSWDSRCQLRILSLIACSRVLPGNSDSIWRSCRCWRFARYNRHHFFDLRYTDLK
jgi:hypothetical protein